MDNLAELKQKLGMVEPEERVVNLLDWLSDQPSPVARLLTGRQVDTQIPQNAVTELQLAILSAFKTKRAAHAILRALVEWVDAGNHHGVWNMCLPSIPVWQAPPISPFNPAARMNPLRWRAVRAAFEDALKTDRTQWDAEFELGLVFLSAVMEGGLHATNLLEALLGQMDKPLQHHGSWSWIDLNLSWRQQNDAEHRRWFVDPLSELLLLGLSQAALELVSLQTGGGRSKSFIWRCIKRVFKGSGLPREHQPPSLSELLVLASYQQLLNGPAYLKGYNRREIVSHSLKPRAWARLLGIRPNLEAWSEQGSDTETCDHNQIEHLGMPEQDDELIESPWYWELMQAIRQKSRPKALAALKDLGLQPQWKRSDIRHHLWLWAEYMFDRGTKSGHKPAVGTVVHYLASAGKRLAALAGDEDIQTLTSEGFAALYQGVLEDAVSIGHRHNIGRALREFHHYLVATCDVAGINDAEVLGTGAGLAVVDANILSIEEYQACLTELRRYPPLLSVHTDLAEAAALIVMIAFRCGTHRMEVLRLRLEDVHISERAIELLIRPWDNRRLKTKSATRKIPLHVFLTADEQSWLKRWHAQRVQQESKRHFSPQLFAIPDVGMDGINQEFLYPKLHQVMRQVTGDPTIRFHHLRHSFASWTTLRLFLADNQEIPQIFPELPDTQNWLNESAQFRQQLYGHEQITRKDLHAVASLLGHASPDMSLEHYVHFLDLIEMMNREASIDHKRRLSLARTMTPVPQRSLYNHGVQQDLPAILALSRKYKPDRTQEQKAPEAVSATGYGDIASRMVAHESDPFAEFRNLWAFLTHRAKHPDYEFDDVCERFDFSRPVAERYLARAKYMRDLEADKTHTPRHRVQSSSCGEEGGLTRGLVPDWPRNKADEQQMLRLGSSLLELIRQPMKEISSGVTVFRLLDYFVENAWLSRHELIFKGGGQSNLVRGYLKLLKQMGVRDDEISVHLFTENPDTAVVWRSAIPEWGNRDFIISSPPNNSSRGLEQSIGIKVIHPILYDGNSGSQGFRTLMHLAAIKAYGVM